MLLDTLKGYTSPCSIVLIVSPLDDIITDQAKSLTRKGLQAVHVKSSSDTEVMAQIVECKFNLIFTSPELLLSNYDWTDVFQSPSLCQLHAEQITAMFI